LTTDAESTALLRAFRARSGSITRRCPYNPAVFAAEATA
jgi:hypothetical protein